MNKELKELLKDAFNAGVMYEATLSRACSFNSFIEDLESKQLLLSEVSQQRELLQTFKDYLHLKYEPLQFDDYDIDCFIYGLQ